MSDQPIEPKTPATEAAARIKELTGNADWSKSYLAGNGKHVAEFNKLQELVSSGGAEARVENQIFLDPNRRDDDHTTAFLRDAGIDDPAILKQVLSGEAVSQQEFDAAKSMKERLMRDHDFQKRYLSGDGEAGRQMILLNVILTRDVKKEAAA